MGRKWNGMNWIRKPKRLAIHIRDGFTCLYCYRDLRDAEPGECTLDHLKAWKRGGQNGETNLVTACRECNRAKDVTPWREFVRDRALEKLAASPWGQSLDVIGMTLEEAATVASERQIRHINNVRRRKLNIALAKSLLEDEPYCGTMHVQPANGEGDRHEIA